jgi:cephalosporin-C deacetylase-like acetyl esterase
MIRAVDYLTSLPNWDGKTVVVIGGSQGGALSIITAALDSRVKALAAFHPALSDITGYIHGRVGGWPELFRGPANRTTDKLETASYYDVVNFARRVKVPGIYSWGYNDETCMPTSTYAAYNSIAAPKTLTLQLATAHNIMAAQNERFTAWIQEFFQTGKAPAPKEESFADR